MFGGEIDVVMLAIDVVMLAIDPKVSAVILAHSVDRGWIVDGLAHLLPHPRSL